MSAQTSQTSLLRAGHRNHYLFSDYYLDRRAPELHEWLIDRVVCRLYGLTEGKIAVVEGKG
jgi:hypothetical protein